jgi:exonuclease SbcD
MKILHSSDWHIGRTFHGHSTLDHLGVVLAALVEIVREREVDVVAVAGDIFDSAMPSAECFTVLSTALRDLRAAGAVVVMTSGNHDSATRLGFQAEWAGLAGIHIVTGYERLAEPIPVDDEYGTVYFYGIPYLEPSMLRSHHPGVDLRTHEQALTLAMTAIRADAAAHESRTVVLSHCFASGFGTGLGTGLATGLGTGLVSQAVGTDDDVSEATDVERDITSGGLNLVPASVFDGPDYVALGHIHGRSTLSDRVRYSGAPLHYSFSEAGKPRGVWLVELDAGGLDTVEWVDLPVPRRLSVLTAPIEQLLGSEEYGRFENDWVSAVLTDRVRPLDAMRRLQARFPFCATLEHRPVVVAEAAEATYRERIAAKSDPEIVAGFLEHVRNGVGPTEFERQTIAEVLAEHSAREVSV